MTKKQLSCRPAMALIEVTDSTFVQAKQFFSDRAIAEIVSDTAMNQPMSTVTSTIPTSPSGP